MLGYTDDELPNSFETFRRLLHPDDLGPTMRRVEAMLEDSNSRYEFEFRMLHKEGRLVDVLSKAFSVRDAAGRVARVVGTHVDMTAIKEDERRLAARERRYRDLVELSPFALFVNRGGRVSYVNPAAMAMFGATEASQLMGRSPFDLFAPEWHEQIRQRIANLQRGEIAPLALEQIVRLDSVVRDVEVVASPFVDDEGPAIQVVLRDVTERVRAEAALESERSRLIRLASVAPGLIYLLRQRPDGTFGFLYASPALLEVFGLRPEDVVENASAVFARVHDDDRQRVITALEASRCRLTDWASDFRVLHPVKGERWLECHSSPEREVDGGTVWAGIAIDVTDRRLADEALRQSQARLIVALEASGMGTWLWDLRDDAVSWDAAAGEILGYHDSVPRTMADLLAQMHPDDRAPGERLLNALRGGSREFSGDFRVQLPGGAMRWITLRGRVTADDRVPGGATQVAGVCLDATDVKRGEETRLRTQKLEALGTLAGGIAHDFNNVLAAIGGHARLALAELPQGHAADASLREIGAAAQRAAELVRQILTFSRPADAGMTIIEIAPVIDEVQRLMRATLPARIELYTHVDAETPVFRGNAIQMHQVLVNLVTNAAHAIGQHGSITITASSLGADADRAAATPGLRPGPYLLLQVHDDGCGMDDQTLQRIFDPFFTTKPQGQGTGLGLSVVHGIVRAHDGTLSVYSRPGKGTTFRVYLPAVAGVVHQEPRPAKTGAPRGAGQHVLYVDDEEALVVYATRMLTRAGYRVTGVSNPREALERFGKDPSAWDAVITDLSMPGISGLELTTALLRLRADVPVLLTTGFLDVQEEQAATRLGIRAILPKPGTPDDMAQALAAVFGLS